MDKKRSLWLIILLVFVFAVSGCAGKKKKAEFVPDGIHCKIDAHCKAGKVCIKGFCKKPKPKGETPAQKAARLLKEANEAISQQVPDCPTALKKIDEAISIIPQYYVEEVKYNKAVCLFYEGNTSEAEAMFEELYKKNPDNPKYVLGLARAKLVWRQNNEALKIYKKFLKKHPREIDVRANYATLLRVMGKDDEALAECREVFIQDPSHPGAFNNMGLLFYKQGKVGLAKWVLNQGIFAQKNAIKMGKRKVEDANLFVNLGVIEMRQGKFLSALDKIKYAQLVDPLNLAVNMNMGNIALQNYDYPEAARCYELALKFDPKNEDAKFGLAVAYRGIGKYEEAAKLYEDLLNKHPKDYKLLWNAGVLYFEFLKDKAKSDELFKRFLKTKKGTKDQRLRAKVYLESEPEEERKEEEHEWVDPVICVRCEQVCPDVQPCEKGQECPELPPEQKKCAPCQKCPTAAMCEKCETIDCTPKDCDVDVDCPPPPPECPVCAICDGIKEIKCQMNPEQCQENKEGEEGAEQKPEEGAAPKEGEAAPANGKEQKDKKAPTEDKKAKQNPPKQDKAKKDKPKEEKPKKEESKKATEKKDGKKDSAKAPKKQDEKQAKPKK